MSESDTSQMLKQQADLIRASGVLGKPGALPRLFDYLLERSLAGDTPKELEIAFKVFGKDSRFDVSQDSVVRVYVHKLRRRLDGYYSGLPVPATARLLIPKGEYRLTVEESAAASTAESDTPVRPSKVRSSWLATACLVLASVAIGAAMTYVFMREPAGEAAPAATRTSHLWAPLFDDDLPITIVLGDYYLLGEADDSGQIRRLVREFFINSADEFVQQVEMSPEVMARYRNLNLSYLPTSSGLALQEILPLLGTKKRVRIALMSELPATALTSSHIVYVGLLSGLGILGEPVFADSRVQIGGSYDDLVDTRTKTRYHSTAVASGEVRYLDYGLISTFPGLGANRIVVIAGTRDTGVVQAAIAASSEAALATMDKAVPREATAVESLMEVQGVGNTGMTRNVLFVSARDPKRLWEMER